MNTTGSPGSPSFTHGYVTDDSRSRRSHVMPAIEFMRPHFVEHVARMAVVPVNADATSQLVDNPKSSFASPGGSIAFRRAAPYDRYW